MSDNCTVVPGSSTVCLSRSDSIGLTLVAESAFLSLVAVLAVLLWLIRNALQKGYRIKSPADLYMISLFSFDLVMAVGHAVDVKWINEGRLYQGGYCTAQGAIQQFGELGSSLATLAIALHTAGVIWGRLGTSLLFACCVVAITWIFVVLFVALGVSLHTSSTEHYETPDGFWCWIGTEYEAEQYAGEYVWLWTTMFVSVITYSLVFLWARGNLTASPSRWLSIRIHRASTEHTDLNAKKIRAARMIAFPLVFAAVVLPLSVVRFRTGFGGERHHIPHAATFAVQFLYSLSGALNVMLFLSTRTGLLLQKPTPGKSAGLWNPADDDEEKSPSHLSADVHSISHSHFTEAHPVEREERPIAMSALPGVEDSTDDW